MKKSFRSIPTAYEMGVEYVSREDVDLPPAPLDGFAVYSGIEGETPQYEGFFPKRWAADRHAAKTHEDGEPLFYDACVLAAVVVPEGLVVENDYTLDTHAKLLARVDEWRAAGWTG